MRAALQVSDDANVMLNGFGTVVNSLKMRAKPYLPQICGTIKWRLNNKSAKIRQQAADLIARIAVVMKARLLQKPDLAHRLPTMPTQQGSLRTARYAWQVFPNGCRMFSKCHASIGSSPQEFWNIDSPVCNSLAMQSVLVGLHASQPISEPTSQFQARLWESLPPLYMQVPEALLLGAGVRRGEAAGAPGRGAVRVPGRGVPGGPGLHPGRAQGHRQCHRHDAHDAAHQGPPPAPHAHPQEPPREGAQDRALHVHKNGNVLLPVTPMQPAIRVVLTSLPHVMAQCLACITCPCGRFDSQYWPECLRFALVSNYPWASGDSLPVVGCARNKPALL